MVSPQTKMRPTPIAWMVSRHPLHHHRHHHLNRRPYPISSFLMVPQPSRHPRHHLHPLHGHLPLHHFPQVQSHLHLPHPQDELLAGLGIRFLDPPTDKYECIDRKNDMMGQNSDHNNEQISNWEKKKERKKIKNTLTRSQWLHHLPLIISTK